jgi:hypothetical protein
MRYGGTAALAQARVLPTLASGTHWECWASVSCVREQQKVLVEQHWRGISYSKEAPMGITSTMARRGDPNAS